MNFTIVTDFLHIKIHTHGCKMLIHVKQSNIFTLNINFFHIFKYTIYLRNFALKYLI